MLCSESLFPLKCWLNLVGKIKIRRRPLFPQPFPPAEKVQAGLGFVRHCSWSWQVSRNNFQQQLPVSGQKDPFACSQYVWSFGPSNGPYGKTNANCWNPETGVSPLTRQAFFLSLKCLACDIIPYFFLSSFPCRWIVNQYTYTTTKLIKHMNN